MHLEFISFSFKRINFKNKVNDDLMLEQLTLNVKKFGITLDVILTYSFMHLSETDSHTHTASLGSGGSVRVNNPITWGKKAPLKVAFTTLFCLFPPHTTDSVFSEDYVQRQKELCSRSEKVLKLGLSFWPTGNLQSGITYSLTMLPFAGLP